jgi:hypothetical protein
MFSSLPNQTTPPTGTSKVLRKQNISTRISSLLLISLFFIVVFDPSDSLTGLKKYFFLALLFWWLLLRVGTKAPPPILPAVILIFLYFGLIFPILSILSYYLQSGNTSDYEGFTTLVGFLSLALLILISSMRVPALDLFLKVLTIQAIITLGLYVYLSLNPALIDLITVFGYDQGFLWINTKDYGGLQFLQIFFKTAPFMVLPVAYYSSQYFNTSRDHKGLDLILLAICSFALLISGTRANMAFAVLIPAYFAVRGIRRAKLVHRILVVFVLGMLVSLLVSNIDILIAMLDPKEESNAVKLGYRDDYIKIFSNPWVLFFGQGIGVVHYFESLGMYLRLTEVTPMELVRNFGIFMAFAYLVFWIAPLFLLKHTRFRDYHWLWIAYASYLVISMSNYFILSSTGMVLLSIIYSVCLMQVTQPFSKMNGLFLRKAGAGTGNQS